MSQSKDIEKASNKEVGITNVQQCANIDSEKQKFSTLQSNSTMSPEEYDQYHKRLDLEREEKEERLRNAKKTKIEYLKQQEKIELQRKLSREGQSTLETYFKKK
mgnify:CR=1 FL=1